jgi:hypothetical protein
VSVAIPLVVPLGGVNQTVPVALFVIWAQPVKEPTQLIDPLVLLNLPEPFSVLSNLTIGFAAVDFSFLALVEQPASAMTMHRMRQVVFFIGWKLSLFAF